MRLPDRVRLVMEQLLRRRRAEEDAEARLERAVERMDEILHDLRRSIADALVLRRAAEAGRDELVAESRASNATEAGARTEGAAGTASTATVQLAEAELSSLVRLEEMLTAAETELHEQVSMIRERMATARARASGAEALAALTRMARGAEKRSEAAQEAVDELKDRVAAAEAGVEIASDRAPGADS